MQAAGAPHAPGRRLPEADPGANAFAGREIVAIVLEHYGRIALFKRSETVGHDRGLWHCITGYLEAGTSPQQQALAELHEEAGLLPADLAVLKRCAPLVLADDRGRPWLAHIFRGVTTRRRLRLNDEHDAYRWTSPSKVTRFGNRVRWLDPVIEAAGPQVQSQRRSSPKAQLDCTRQGKGRIETAALASAPNTSRNPPSRSHALEQ